MCGIIGFSYEDQKNLDSSLKSISHRGPDDTGKFVDKVSLGHKRLSIIDLSKKGHQPMKRLNYVIVFNGEIYNYKDLNLILEKDYDFKSNSDTETLIYAFDKWGEKCLDKLNGMFSFCIYDINKCTFFIARDRFGIKPFYYTVNKKGLAFCSEIKGLFGIIKKEVDLEGLSQFFTYRFTLGETTLFKNVKKLNSGCCLTYDVKSKKLNIKKYYNPSLSKFPCDNFLKLNETIKQVKTKIEESVKLRLVSDVPVGCFLSGGLDSSIIAYYAKKHSKELNTFSIGFDTTNELSWASKVAKRIGTNHREFLINKNNVENYLDKMVWHMDEPIGDPGFLPIYVLSKEARKYNKVVLSGDGSDEIFCGYDRYKLFKYGSLISPFLFSDFGNDILKRVKKFRFGKDFNNFSESIRLFQKGELKDLKLIEFDARNFWSKDKDILRSAQKFDLDTLLPNDFLMKSDKMGSAFGLEQRVPFLDHNLVELSLKIPTKYKLKLFNEKYLLKKAYDEELDFVVKRKKHGFNVPIDYWFSNVLGDKLRKLLDERNHNLYDFTYVYKLLKRIKELNTTKTKNYVSNFLIAQKLWSILMFEMWFKKMILK